MLICFFFLLFQRFNLGSGAQILTVGRNLSDGHWHNVSIKRSGDQTALTVDHVTVTRSSRGKEFSFGSLATNSPVYVGGLPAWYGGELTRLALPSVLFEPRYRGDLRNVIYSDAAGQPARQQEMLESQVKTTSRRFPWRTCPPPLSVSTPTIGPPRHAHRWRCLQPSIGQAGHLRSPATWCTPPPDRSISAAPPFPRAPGDRLERKKNLSLSPSTGWAMHF